MDRTFGTWALENFLIGGWTSKCSQNNGLKVIRWCFRPQQKTWPNVVRLVFSSCCPHTQYRGCVVPRSLQVDGFNGQGHNATTLSLGRFEVPLATTGSASTNSTDGGASKQKRNDFAFISWYSECSA
ncbi:unnamed protein product [Aphanomyces euteiches]